MVIDDNSSIAQLLSIMLKSNGYTPITAPNGLAALDTLKTCPLPALILTDYAMPVLNGCEFIENISVHTKFKDIPVVIITGSAIDDLKLPKTGNFKGIIQKPFSIGTVLETIQDLTASDEYSSSVCPV